MRKLIGVIVVLFIILVMMSVFGYIKEFGILDNMGANIYASYGTVGSFFFYTIYIGIFFGVTSWTVKTSWRKITSKANKVESEIKPSINTHKMTKNIEENKKTSKICDNCKTENVNEAKFCMNCGKQNFNENYNQDKFKKEEVNPYKVKTLTEEDELEKIRNKYVENYNKRKAEESLDSHHFKVKENEQQRMKREYFEEYHKRKQT